MPVSHETRARAGEVSVKGQIVSVSGFASYTLPQLLSPAVVARKPPHGTREHGHGGVPLGFT